MQLEPAPLIWEDGLNDPPSQVEIQLKASIDAAARRISPSTVELTAAAFPIRRQEQIQPTAVVALTQSTHAQLIAGCGVAAVDGYLAMRDYAVSKGLDLAECHHKGIDLQDLISTLIIDLQRRAEMEGRADGARRFKR